MSEQARAAEHTRFTVSLPKGIELRFSAGYYGHKGLTPIWWTAQRGGRAAMAKNPYKAVRSLLAWEKVTVRPL